MAKIVKGAKALHALVAQIDALYPTVDKPAKQADLLLERIQLVKSIIAMETARSEAAEDNTTAAQDQEITVLNEQLVVAMERVSELEDANRKLETAAVLARIAAPTPAVTLRGNEPSPAAADETPLPLPAPKHREFDAKIDLAWRHTYTKPEPVKPTPPAPQPYIEDLRDAETKLREAKAMTRASW
jgi:hypothetical protein